MIALWAFNALAFLCNWMLVSSSVLKDDSSLRTFKESPNEFEYIVKRPDMDDRKEDTESKERRSNMGSSFIRFGRGQSFDTVDNSAFDNEIDSKVSRHPRWKSPDVVIRFGRSGLKAINGPEQPKRGKSDLNFIRFGRNIQVVPDLDLSTMCSALMSNSAVRDAGPYPDVTRLFRLCNNLNKIAGEISLDTHETVSNHRE